MGISAKPSEILFNQFNKSFFKIGAAAKSDVFSLLDFQNSKKDGKTVDMTSEMIRFFS